MENNYSIIYHPIAEKEYLESVVWYENKLIGLGHEFVQEIENTLDQIDNNPFLFPVKKFQLREAIVSKFPFVIIFELKQKQSQIIIISVYHTSRNPKKKFRK